MTYFLKQADRIQIFEETLKFVQKLGQNMDVSEVCEIFNFCQLSVLYDVNIIINFDLLEVNKKALKRFTIIHVIIS